MEGLWKGSLLHDTGSKEKQSHSSHTLKIMENEHLHSFVSSLILNWLIFLESKSAHPSIFCSNNNRIKNAAAFLAHFAKTPNSLIVFFIFQRENGHGISPKLSMPLVFNAPHTFWGEHPLAWYQDEGCQTILYNS